METENTNVTPENQEGGSKTETENINAAAENQEEEEYIECPNCKTKVNIQEPYCPKCGCSMKSETADNTIQEVFSGIKEVNQKRNFPIKKLVISIVVVAFICGLVSVVFTSYKRIQYKDGVKTIYGNMTLAGQSADSIMYQRLNVWYNAIHKEKDEYNNGDYSDFNNALKAYATAKSTEINQLKNLEKTIQAEMNNLPSVPKDYINLRDAMAKAYVPLSALIEQAVYPTGSYSTYDEEYYDLIKEYRNAISELEVAISLY